MVHLTGTTTDEVKLDLVRVEALNAVEVFRDPTSLDAVVARIKAEALEASKGLDVSTAAGRQGIKSLAYRVTRSKTALFDMAKGLTDSWRKQTTQVNAERNRMEDALDELANSIRQPLTEFENREKNRIAAHEEKLKGLTFLHAATLDVDQMEMAKSLIQKNFEGHNWEEFAGRARQLRDDSFEKLNQRIESQKMADAVAAKQAELRRKQAEAEEAERQRLQTEREERLKAEAAEMARKAAEQKAEAERKLEADRVAREKARLESEARDAQEAARRADEQRKAAEQKAAQDILNAQLKADREREAAVQAERDRQAEAERIAEAKRQAEAEAIAKREADQKHRAKVELAAQRDLYNALPMDEGLALEVVNAIAAGRISNLKVVY